MPQDVFISVMVNGKTVGIYRDGEGLDFGEFELDDHRIDFEQALYVLQTALNQQKYREWDAKGE